MPINWPTRPDRPVPTDSTRPTRPDRHFREGHGHLPCKSFWAHTLQQCTSIMKAMHNIIAILSQYSYYRNIIAILSKLTQILQRICIALAATALLTNPMPMPMLCKSFRTNQALSVWGYFSHHFLGISCMSRSIGMVIFPNCASVLLQWIGMVVFPNSVSVFVTSLFRYRMPVTINWHGDIFQLGERIVTMNCHGGYPTQWAYVSHQF